MYSISWSISAGSKQTLPSFAGPVTWHHASAQPQWDLASAADPNWKYHFYRSDFPMEINHPAIWGCHEELETSTLSWPCRATRAATLPWRPVGWAPLALGRSARTNDSPRAARRRARRSRRSLGSGWDFPWDFPSENSVDITHLGYLSHRIHVCTLYWW